MPLPPPTHTHGGLDARIAQCKGRRLTKRSSDPSSMPYGRYALGEGDIFLFLLIQDGKQKQVCSEVSNIGELNGTCCRCGMSLYRQLH